MGKQIFRLIHQRYRDGYSIAFVNISNINDVIASTGQFNVGAGPSGTPSSTGSTASGSGSSAASVSVT